MNGFELDPGSLRRGDQDLQAVIQQTAGDLDRFDAELASHGEPWGRDDLGSMIGEVYRGAYAMAMNCLNSNLDTMDGYAERLSINADAYEGTDEQVASRLDAIRQAGGSVDIPR
jgi:hypothetical protein